MTRGGAGEDDERVGEPRGDELPGIIATPARYKPRNLPNANFRQLSGYCLGRSAVLPCPSTRAPMLNSAVMECGVNGKPVPWGTVMFYANTIPAPLAT